MHDSPLHLNYSISDDNGIIIQLFINFQLNYIWTMKRKKERFCIYDFSTLTDH